MDNGQLFLNAFRVLPCLGGGFVVTFDGYERTGIADKKWAFSNITDLMAWLNANAFAGMKTDQKE